MSLSAASSSLVARLASALPVLALLAFTITRSWGREQWIDLHPDDEAHYLLLGQAIATGEALPGLAYSPAYCVLAYAVFLVTPHGLLPADVIYWALLLGTTLALVWALTPLMPTYLGTMAAAWWVCLPAVQQSHVQDANALPNVYLMGMLQVCLVLGSLARERYRIALLLMALVPLVRPDGVLWVAAFPLLLLTLRAKQALGRQWRWSLVIAAAVSATLLLPSMSERSWIAFSQHYARHAMLHRLQEKHGVAVGDVVDPSLALAAWLEMQRAFEQPEQIVAEDFHGAKTVPGALVAAPGRFLTFLGLNFAAAPEMIAVSVQPTGFAAAWWHVLLSVLAIAGALGWWIRWRHRAPAHPVAAGFLGLPTCLLAMALVGARIELLMPIHTFLVAAIGTGLAALLPTRGGCKPHLAVAVGLLVVTTMVPGPFQARSPHQPAHREALALVNATGLADDARVLVDRRGLYALFGGGKRVQWLQPDMLSPTASTVAGLLRSGSVDHVLLNVGLAVTLPELDHALRSGAYADWHLLSELGRTSLWGRRH